MSNQAITNGEQGVNATGFGHRQIMLSHADDQTTDQVDQKNQQAGHGVTAHEFRSTVHGTEEVRFLGQFSTALFGSFLVNHASVQVSVN